MNELLEQENIQTVESALASIPISELERNNYPILSHIQKSDFRNFNNPENSNNIFNTWKKVFDENNFITPNSTNFNPNTDVLLILHPFKDSNGEDHIFKAVTTLNIKDFINDPTNSINYGLHGQPCENRSHGVYPTIKFADFYEQLPVEERKKYQIQDRNWRKSFYEKH
ncbi:MAG: hypothetical protein PHP08_04010 [Candidatus Dojkabacteria bacterium]|nr:hypothetical protein [Candidatus Dojkabacteria bacterium]